MTSKEGNYTGLINTIKTNRFLYMAMVLNLLIYTIFFIFTKNNSSNFLTGLSWIILTGYIIASEIILKIVNNSALSSEKSCNNIFILNTVLTSGVLLLLTLLMGNKDYLFLCIIPIFQAALEKKNSLMVVILGLSTAFILAADFCGWFNFYYLPANQGHIILKTFSFLIVLGVLSALGIAIAKSITFTQGKADYLHSVATTDALTGLTNRREFNLRISEEFARAKRHKSPLSFALFDIDFFKKINDTHGHNAGDTILRELGKLISSNTRSCDIASRYGGEEFALILPETTQVKAYELVDRLRHLVETEIFNKKNRPIKATISVGVAQLDLTDISPLDFCERTDKALYKAKESGRNRVEKASFGVPKFNISSAARKKAV